MYCDSASVAGPPELLLVEVIYNTEDKVFLLILYQLYFATP